MWLVVESPVEEAGEMVAALVIHQQVVFARNSPAEKWKVVDAFLAHL